MWGLMGTIKKPFTRLGATVFIIRSLKIIKKVPEVGVEPALSEVVKYL
jgi:hypothetical protein